MLLNILFHRGKCYFHTAIGAMIEYAKVILPKVTFSKFLFRKELLKCIGWSKPEELGKLKQWCFHTFSNQYPDVLDEAFAKASV